MQANRFLVLGFMSASLVFSMAWAEPLIRHGDIIPPDFDERDTAIKMTTPDGEIDVVKDRLNVFFRVDDPKTPGNEEVSDKDVSAVLYQHRLDPMGLDRKRGMFSIRARPRSAAKLLELKTELEGTPGVERVEFIPAIEFVVPRREPNKNLALDARGEIVLDPTEHIAIFTSDDGKGRGSNLVSPDGLALALTAPFDPAKPDKLTLSASLKEGQRQTLLTETGDDTLRFESESHKTTLVVQSVQGLDEETEGRMAVLFSDAPLGIPGRPFSLREEAPDSLTFRNEAFAASLMFTQAPDPAAPDRIDMAFSSPLVPLTSLVELVEDAPDSLRFASPDGAFHVTLPAFPTVDTNVRDNLTAVFTSEGFGVTDLTLELAETWADSLDFSNVDPRGSDVEPPKKIRDLSSLTVFKIRLNVTAGLGPVHVATLKTARGEKAVELRRAPNGSYLSKPILATTEPFEPSFEDVQDLQLLLVDPDQGHQDISVKGSPEKKVDAAGKAFVGFYEGAGEKKLPGDTVDEIIKTLTSDLGYNVTPDKSLTRVEAKTASQKHVIWYTDTHGIDDVGTDSAGIEVQADKNDDPAVRGKRVGRIFPGDFAGTRPPVPYDLVFPSACRMGEDLKGRQDFFRVFDPKVYIGFFRASMFEGGAKVDVKVHISNGYAIRFFKGLDGINPKTKKPNTVKDAFEVADEYLLKLRFFKSFVPFRKVVDDTHVLDLKP